MLPKISNDDDDDDDDEPLDKESRDIITICEMVSFLFTISMPFFLMLASMVRTKDGLKESPFYTSFA